MNPLINLIGKRFGRLTVLRKGTSNEFFHVRWVCVCDCGKISTVLGVSLRSGDTKSCGCYLKESVSERRFIDLTGMTFGKWTVISCEGTNVGGTGTKWNCRCVCGVVRSIFYTSLVNGRSSSCGCQRNGESKIATDVKKYFKENYLSISEYKIVKNPETGKYLPFDIYIPKLKIFIEINGKQHYEFVRYFHRNELGFSITKRRDLLKINYAKKNGNYIEVNLGKINSTKQAVEYIERKILFLGKVSHDRYTSS